MSLLDLDECSRIRIARTCDYLRISEKEFETYSEELEMMLLENNVALEVAEKTGNTKTVNVVMIGVLSNYLDFKQEIWSETFNSLIPKKHLDINLTAFKMGREL